MRDSASKVEADHARSEINKSVATGRGHDRLAALGWTESRCRSFTDGELSYPELKSLKTSREATQDPLLKLRAEVSKTPSGELDTMQKRDLISKLFSVKEPTMLETVHALAYTDIQGKSGESAIYVNSVPYGGLDPESFNLAWRLMRCKVTATCDAADVGTRRACAYLGVCAHNISEEVRLLSGAQYAKVLSVADQLVQIVEREDAQGLLPQR